MWKLCISSIKCLWKVWFNFLLFLFLQLNCMCEPHAHQKNTALGSVYHWRLLCTHLPWHTHSIHIQSFWHKCKSYYTDTITKCLQPKSNSSNPSNLNDLSKSQQPIQMWFDMNIYLTEGEDQRLTAFQICAAFTKQDKVIGHKKMVYVFKMYLRILFNMVSDESTKGWPFAN